MMRIASFRKGIEISDLQRGRNPEPLTHLCACQTPAVPLLSVGVAIGVEQHRALSGLLGPWERPPPDTPLHQPWPLPLLSSLSSVFRAERRAKKGRGPEGEQGGSGERAETLPKRELNVLVGEHTSERLTLVF